jgi:hypothetical protein
MDPHVIMASDGDGGFRLDFVVDGLKRSFYCFNSNANSFFIRCQLFYVSKTRL